MANPSNHYYPNVALLASSGVGHLTPLLRFAASLVHHHCQVTLITCHPILTLAESQLISNFFSAFPQVTEKQLHLLPPDPNHSNSNENPFTLHWEAATHSVLHLLPAILSSLSPSPCALVSDVTLISSVFSVTENLNLPVYVLFTSCARMFSLFAYYPIAAGADFSKTGDVIEIPGGLSMPKSMIPPPLLVPNSIFALIFMEGGKNITKSSGIFINTFERLETDTLAVLKSGKVVKDLPPLYTVGLMAPCEFERETEHSQIKKWLDDQLQGSVVYVCFGSKVAMSREQIREIGDGLIRSGYPFLWVVKDKEFDREDVESLNEVLGNELLEKIKTRGLVVKEWVNQGEILGHLAVGGFVSHCGWNSVVEAAWHGVRLLAWLSTGDQKINKEVVEKSGLGLCTRNWGWVGEMVKGEELGERIKEMMGHEELKLQAKQIREEARKAVGVGGSCENALMEVIEKWKNMKLNF